jgi:putative acetyltransferase
MNYSLRPARAEDHEALVDIWLRSVRSSHAFLSEADIQHLLPLVRTQALPALELWVLCAEDRTPVGFMGLDGAKLEAMFIVPEFKRQGGGKLLLSHARALKGPLTVDVNEQNHAATAFWLANGFKVAGRSPTDGGGRPFPLLHLVEG